MYYQILITKKIIMGKGDKKTKKGKISQGSYGVTRKRKKPTPVVASAKPKKVAPKKAEEKAETVKPAAKKAPAKKTATAEKKPAAAKKPAAKKTTTKSTSKKEA